MSDTRRLFNHCLDPVDGILCVAAERTPREVAALAGPHGLRFPLFLDASTPLSAQIDASAFAPAASRFGPFCDNITGMNWRLPSDRVVRVGERVVKSTTGYDLLRFLLHSGDRFGRPVDYVLRLRPACALSGVFELRGLAVREAAAAVIADCWIHWFDSVDLVIAPDGDAFLRIAVNCPSAEWPVFNTRLSALAREHGLDLADYRDAGAPMDGLPDLVVKTAPHRAMAMAADSMTRVPGTRGVVLCQPGVIHFHLPDESDTESDLPKLLSPLRAELDDLGGDWHSRHVAKREIAPPENDWLDVLEEEFVIS